MFSKSESGENTGDPMAVVIGVSGHNRTKPPGVPMRVRPLIVVFALTGLLACSLTVGVRGQLEDGSETFKGSVTGHSNHSGEIHMDSSKPGVTLDGEFVFATRREGSGVIKTSDGRVGKFTFVSTGRNGNGFGDLGGKRFVFTFGGDVERPKAAPEKSE